jgi:hypothetical protein
LKFIVSTLAIKFPGLPQPRRQADARRFRCWNFRIEYIPEPAEITPSQGFYAESRNLRYPRNGRPFIRLPAKILLVIAPYGIQFKEP